MKVYQTGDIRNIGIAGHSGAGKTSLLELMLFNSGFTTRPGKVEDGTTVTDYLPEEIKRQVTISSSLAPVEWKDTKLNMIDTPGYADFIGEVIATTRVFSLTRERIDAGEIVPFSSALVNGHIL